MSDNTHGIGVNDLSEQIEQDSLKTKLDLITVASSVNLNTISNQTIVNKNNNDVQDTKFTMETSSGLKSYAEDSRTLLTTNTANINNLDTPLTTDSIKFNINGAYAILANGLRTGSALSTTNPLSSTLRRYILLRSDTYSSNITLLDADTKFSPNQSGSYLSIISYEIYDNSADTKTIELELYGDTEGSLQMARNTITGTSTNYEYERVNNTMVINLVSGRNYYYRAKSNNGGVINAFATVTNLTLIKINKSF